MNRSGQPNPIRKDADSAQLAENFSQEFACLSLIEAYGACKKAQKMHKRRCQETFQRLQLCLLRWT